MKSPFSSTKSEKEIYQEEYQASKQGGESFFPDTMVRDAIVALLVVAAIFTLAIVLPAKLEPPADPASTTYNPRPEWYFLFFFQFLKFFPGWLEPVAAVVIPIVALLILALLPFLNRGLKRRWSERKPIISAGILVVLILIALEVTGARSAPAIPAGEESPLVQAGRDVYREINCAYCHSINGVGGNIGPDLSTVGGKLEKDELATYLQDPHAMVPTTLHPKLLFTDEEMEALISYLLTLGAPTGFSAEAPTLYEEYCSSCHMINGKGGTLGPDLSAVGKRRTINFLEDFTADPRSVLPDVIMPVFRDILTPEQIKDIAAYLASLKGEAPPQIPHTLEGRSACLACHQTGVMGAPIVPTGHAGRTDDTCTTCHQPKE